LGDELDVKIKVYFLSGAYKTILLQGSIALLTFFTSLFIARVTGDKGFGVYTTVFTWISIISVGATLGLDDLALKQLPIYQEEKSYSKIKGFLSWANWLGAGFGIVCAILLLVIANYTTIHGISEYADYYFWAVWVIPLFALMHINQAALRALKFFGWGQLAEKFVQPLAFFLFLAGIYFVQDFYLSDKNAIVARALSFVITAIVALYLMFKYTQKERSVPVAEYEVYIWWGSCKYFAITSLLYIINTRIDIVLLGLYQVPEAQIAYYNAALKLSDMALIPFAVLYTVTAPMFSKLYATKKKKELQAFFTKTSRLACLLISVILLALGLGGEWLLGLFGDSFRLGYEALLILCVVKFVHVFVGPVNYLMMMIGLEKEATCVLLLSVLLTIILHMAWIPNHGITGAAYASLIGLLLFEVLISWLCYKKGGIVPTILGSFLSRKDNSSK
jgi:O-antigen/teichoic acid export membrane protein